MEASCITCCGVSPKSRNPVPWIAACAGLALIAAGAARAAPAPVVVELFTSQGCSSCPPADALVGELAQDPSVLALTEHVGYWDYLGWKDTLASPAFTRRQRAYETERGNASVYTPEMIVGGATAIIGSRRREVMAAIEAARKAPAVPVALHREGGTLKAEIGSGPLAVATMWLAIFKREVSVAIGGGEISGRRIDYWNVLRSIDLVGQWQGAPLSMTLPMPELAGDENLALILQRGAYGPILGAASLKAD